MNTSISFQDLPERPGRGIDVLVIAGEPSGDEHAAELVAALLEREPRLSICALGGPAVKAAGAHLLYDMTTEAAVVGFWDVLVKYSFFKSLFSKTLAWIERYSPKTVLFVDYPGFNLRLAEALYKKRLSRKAGGAIRTLYYIAPQVWAWKAKRRFALARYVEALAVLFPFEVEVFKDTGVPVTCVGHPHAAPEKASTLAYNKQAPVLLLPGSRPSAVARIYPVMLKAFAHYIRQHDPKAQAISIAPNDKVRALLEGQVREQGLQDHISFRLSGSKVFGRAVLVSAGTMSLRCALAGIPGALVYLTHPLTYMLGRWWLRVPHLGLASLVLRKTVYPEYLQSQALPETLAQALYEAQKTEQVENMAAHARALRSALGSGNQGTVASWFWKEHHA